MAGGKGKPGAAMDRISCFRERKFMREKVVSFRDHCFSMSGAFCM